MNQDGVFKVLAEFGELKPKANIEITTSAARVLLKVNEFELTPMGRYYF